MPSLYTFSLFNRRFLMTTRLALAVVCLTVLKSATAETAQPAITDSISLPDFRLAQSVESVAIEARRDFRAFSPDAPDALRTGGNSMQGNEEIVAVVYPRHRFLLSLSVSGVVAKVPVTEGDFVEANDLLIALEQDLERLELQRLELMLKETEILQASAERLALIGEQARLARQLYEESRSISRDELNALEMQHIMLKAEHVSLRLQKEREALDFAIGQGSLDKRNLRAPHPGFITRITVKPGEWAQAGDPIVELVDSTESFIRFSLPNQRAQSLLLNDPISFEVEGVRAEGYISFISPVADPASGLVEVQVSFDNTEGRIRPGLSARVFL